MTISEFVKRKEYLVCVDSDGCAMDTMEIKHKKCFGPCLIEEWGLDKWRDRLLSRWNDINLYNDTRGINRFKGLYMLLKEVDAELKRIDGLDGYAEWLKSTKEFSNSSLRQAVEKSDCVCLNKALSWSENLNRAIDALSENEKVPFEGVAQTLEKIHEFADVAIVSSANGAAVAEEWKRYDILRHTDIMLTQEEGDKIFCISAMKKKGYDENRVLMVGDAVGDYNAAKTNNAHFFPILVRREPQSWSRLRQEGFPRFLSGGFDREYQQSLLAEFYSNFGGKKE